MALPALPDHTDGASRQGRADADAIVVIGASTGGLDPLRQILGALPVPCPAAIFVVVHIGRHDSVLPSLLGNGIPASFARSGMAIERGHIYVAPPDHHMVLVPGMILLNRRPKVHHARPAADPLFMSAAEAYGKRVVGIVLSGGDGDGAAGLQAIGQHGGLTFVQNPSEVSAAGMPRAAIAAGRLTGVLPAAQIAERLAAICR